MTIETLKLVTTLKEDSNFMDSINKINLDSDHAIKTLVKIYYPDAFNKEIDWSFLNKRLKTVSFKKAT